MSPAPAGDASEIDVRPATGSCAATAHGATPAYTNVDPFQVDPLFRPDDKLLL